MISAQALLAGLICAWASRAPALPFAYVPLADERGRVVVIDTATDTATTTLAVGSQAYGVAVSPSGRRLYVARCADDSVLVVDAVTLTPLATVAVGNCPWGVAVDPAGSRVYVTNQSDNTLSVIDAGTNRVVTTVQTLQVPNALVVNPAGTRLYIACQIGVVSVVETTYYTRVAKLGLSITITGVALNPAGTRVYVTDGIDARLSVVDTELNARVANVYLGGSADPIPIAVHPDGTRVYVGNSARVSVMDAGTNIVTATVFLSLRIRGLAAHPDGRRLYAATGDDSQGNVSVVDTESNTVTHTIPLESSAVPQGFAIGPETIAPDGGASGDGCSIAPRSHVGGGVFAILAPLWALDRWRRLAVR